MAFPITCHVLNTLSGTPANNLGTRLTLLSPILSQDQVGVESVFVAVTDEDGRVTQWQSQRKTFEEISSGFEAGQRTAWSIKLDIGPWYEQRGIESFWPEIEVKFYVRKGDKHCHVPILVGPWTYTTYRGS